MQPELLAGVAGAVGRGRLAAVPPRSLSAISQQGWGCPGGMTLEKLGQGRTRHLSVPCGHSDAGGGGFC